MVSTKHPPGPQIVYFKTRKYLGSNEYASGPIPGKKLVFNKSSGDADKFEEVMEVQTKCFNEIIAGADISKFDLFTISNFIKFLTPKI